MELIDYYEGRTLTSRQLDLLEALLDGEWHDRKYLREKLDLKKLIPSILSERIIKPLESMGLVEQEERPIKEGSRKNKKFVRIKKYPDMLVLLNQRDLYQKNKNEKAYIIFDQLCCSHEERGGPSQSFSPAEIELAGIAKCIEQYCKTPAMAFAAACVARPDLYAEYREWTRSYSK